jgi:hypothetical protein
VGQIGKVQVPVPGGKSGRDLKLTPPSSVEIKNGVQLNHFSPMCLHDEHKDSSLLCPLSRLRLSTFVVSDCTGAIVLRVCVSYSSIVLQEVILWRMSFARI